MRILLPPVAQSAPDQAPATCPRCGSKGFNLHQRTWKPMRDPDVARVQVLRYVCKRCGHAQRVYPAGVGLARQSAATREIARLLGAMGISARGVAGLLAGLGCALSPSGVRNNLRRAGVVDQPATRLRLAPSGPTSLRGPDGALTVRLGGPSPLARWLEVEVGPGPQAGALLSRLLGGLHSHQEVRATALPD